MPKTPEMQQFVDDFSKKLFGDTPDGHCVACKRPFSDKIVFTSAGWKETKISKMCEACWDETFKEE